MISHRSKTSILSNFSLISPHLTSPQPPPPLSRSGSKIEIEIDNKKIPITKTGSQDQKEKKKKKEKTDPIWWIRSSNRPTSRTSPTGDGSRVSPCPLLPPLCPPHPPLPPMDLPPRTLAPAPLMLRGSYATTSAASATPCLPRSAGAVRGPSRRTLDTGRGRIPGCVRAGRGCVRRLGPRGSWRG